jgi:hypothetical protein
VNVSAAWDGFARWTGMHPLQRNFHSSTANGNLEIDFAFPCRLCTMNLSVRATLQRSVVQAAFHCSQHTVLHTACFIAHFIELILQVRCGRFGAPQVEGNLSEE